MYLSVKKKKCTVGMETVPPCLLQSWYKDRKQQPPGLGNISDK